MKRIPDLLSMSRIVLCLPLLIVDAMTIPFWVIYLIAGLTDILDGFLARRWGVESKFGARLDSLADFVFVLVVGYKLFPWLRLPATLWMMIGLIALVKVVNAISSYVVKRRIEFLQHGVVSGYRYRVARLPMWRDDAVGSTAPLYVQHRWIVY